MSASENTYIKTRARSLPLYHCLCNEDWDEAAMAHILVARQMGGGKIIFGVYLIDLLEEGLKETFFQMGLTEADFKLAMQEVFPEEYFKECDPSIVHNLIFGAVDYFEEEAGIKPPKEFKLTEYLLDPELITDEIDAIKFGVDREYAFEIGDSSPMLKKFMDERRENEGL